MKTTTNRTYWPTTGGSIAFQPGWFQGHAQAQIFINLGFGTDGPDNGPQNMSNPMIPQFGILGPSKNPYPGTICLPRCLCPPTPLSTPATMPPSRLSSSLFTALPSTRYVSLAVPCLAPSPLLGPLFS